MKAAISAGFNPRRRANNVSGIIPSEIVKLLPIVVGIKDNTNAKAATTVPSTKILVLYIKKLLLLNIQSTKEK
jgi:hypothetical protein